MHMNIQTARLRLLGTRDIKLPFKSLKPELKHGKTEWTLSQIPNLDKGAMAQPINC